MSTTLTVRLPAESLEWIRRRSKETGLAQGRLVKEAIDVLRERQEVEKPFLELAGSLDGPRNLSQRKGFSKS